MVDEPTLGELHRRLTDDRAAADRVHEALDRRITDTVAGSVSSAVHSADYARLTDRLGHMQASIDAISAALRDHQQKVASQRLVIFTSVVAPLVVLILSGVLIASGLGQS